IGALGRFDQADEARLRQVMEVNFFAPAEFIREALLHLKAGNRSIVVNIGSVLGHRAVPEKSEYCASKFALHGFSDSLRAELAPLGIDVLLVSPSTTTSEFFDVAAGQSSKPQGRFGAMPAETVAQRTAAAIAAGKHEIILSASGKFLVWLDRLCPPLADWLITRW
ncbi:MAG TPA: SDR family NAD(P)-dependent oxidoreductase, partial [Pirellulaceae bacterium]|nr:SDR family NAD(P)-dependent oxidoreductase [Pirellulaceae bacterium]